MSDVRIEVRDHYAKIAGTAKTEGAGCGCGCGCGPADGSAASSGSERLGYNRVELSEIPREADMGLGCGNPTAIAELRPGETVVDLGSGGGIDCFLAARRVGPGGKVIGVDMTPQMLDRARTAAARGSYGNVEFRLGEIENLPVADCSVDAIVSNCVINLSPDKKRVFREAWRVLKPGGRLMVSDIMLNEPLPEAARKNARLWAGCVSGALPKEEYLSAVCDAGFSSVEVRSEHASGELLDDEERARLRTDAPELSEQDLERLNRAVVSVALYAVK